MVRGRQPRAPSTADHRGLSVVRLLTSAWWNAVYTSQTFATKFNTAARSTTRSPAHWAAWIDRKDSPRSRRSLGGYENSNDQDSGN